MSMRKSSGIVKHRLPTLINLVIKFLKRFKLFLVIVIIAAALLSSLFRALTPWATQYKPQLEQHLSHLLGEQVTINSMETGWYWFEPVIKLNHVTIVEGKQQVIQLNKLWVGINLWSSLWHWQIQPGVLYIDDVKLTVRQIDSQWQVDGLNDKGAKPVTFDKQSYTPLLAWILTQQKIIIKRLSLDIYLQDGGLLAMRDINLLVGNKANRYRIKGTANLQQAVPTQLELLGDLNLDPYHLADAQGQVYVSALNFQPVQWQGFFKQTRYHILDGKTNLKLWLDLNGGRVEKAQGQLQAINLDWSEGEHHYRVDSLLGDFAWQTAKDGWQLNVDQMGLQLNGVLWPQNKLNLAYHKHDEQWSGYVQHVLLDSLLALDVPWPSSLEKLKAAQVRGELNDLQIKIKQGNVDYLLSQFSHLGWNAAENYPGVANLSGVIHWQPTEGRLELDSVNTQIEVLHKLPIELSVLNGAMDWKDLANGRRVSVERLVLRNPDLLLSGSGMVDNLTANSAGFINASVQVSATNAQQWLPYIPGEHLKRKLDRWLKQDIHRINKLVADVAINGQAKDFPFDKTDGEFDINAHVSGVDLIFAKDWPLSKDVEAYVHVNKRDLEADVVYANLQGAFVDQVNLAMKGIGLSRETLLAHGKVNTNTSKAQAYIMASPLHKKLSALNLLKMRGAMALDLRLEVPLYPENDEILALGDIQFNDNRIDVHHSLNDIQLTEVNGTLQFDQEGVLDSNLNAQVFNNPVSLLIQSVRDPNPRTEVKIKGKTSISILQNQIKAPIFNLLRGDLWLEGVLVLTDNPGDLDHFQVRSSLVGVEVAMPKPLGKPAAAKVPLTIDIAFNTNKALQFNIDYGDRLNGNLWFSGNKGQFQLQKGEIRIGPTNARPQQQQGLQIVGSLPSFDLQQWRDTLAKLPADQDQQGVMDMVHFIDFKLAKATIGGHQFDDLSIKATRLPHDDWGVQINQQRVAASLRYLAKTKTVTGVFEQLIINKADLQTQQHKPIALQVANMPNVDVRIKDFQYGDLDLGQVALKMTRLDHSWQLDYGKINSPAYQMVLSGQWQQQGETNQTKVDVNLHINDLAKTLNRWHISPVIEEATGNVRLESHWSGSYLDFSLANLQGSMSFNLKDGRITHLSEQTEEKLGLGKLLSILSLQTIPRRLKLDFSDLANDGYSFDILQGNFSITKGVMTTTDSYIDGPVAYASMKGNLDIAKQLYDVDLRVSPHITASLPVVATIAGGPIAGIATWVASKIINQGMQKISGYTYKVSGPWKHPVVQQVGIFRKK